MAYGHHLVCESVCLSVCIRMYVCLSARISQNDMSKRHEMSCTCCIWPRLGPPLTTMQCTGWAKKVIPLIHILHCTRGITFLAHPVCYITYMYFAFVDDDTFSHNGANGAVVVAWRSGSVVGLDQRS